MSERGSLARSDLIKNSEGNTRLTKRDKELTAINPEDEVAFAEFLSQPKTGFLRLHDSSACNESRNIIDANSPCPYSVTGKATAFSFRKKIYAVSTFPMFRITLIRLESRA